MAGAKIASFESLTEHIEEVGRVLQDAGPKGERRPVDSSAFVLLFAGDDGSQ